MNDTTITIKRTFNAPRQLAWNAWTDPTKLAQWFGAGLPAPTGYTTIDLRPGGKWESTMVLSEDGSATKKFWGEYQELDEPAKLVLTLTDDPAAHSRITVTLLEVNGRTEMSFSQVGPLPQEHVSAATEGWESFFTQLEALIVD